MSDYLQLYLMPVMGILLLLGLDELLFRLYLMADALSQPHNEQGKKNTKNNTNNTAINEVISSKKLNKAENKCSNSCNYTKPKQKSKEATNYQYCPFKFIKHILIPFWVNEVTSIIKTY